MPSKYKDLFKNHQFILLWVAGSILDNIGGCIGFIPIIVLLNKFYGGDFLPVGIFFAITNIIPFLWSPIAGVICDRIRKPKILFIANFIAIFTTLCYIISIYTNYGFIIYIVAIFQYSTAAFYGPAINSFLPEIVDKSHLFEANVIEGISYSFFQVFASALGGLILLNLGYLANFLFESGSYIISTILYLILYIKFNSVKNEDIELMVMNENINDEKKEKESIYKEFVLGIKYISENIDILFLTLFKLITEIIFSAIAIINVLYADKYKINDSVELSLAISYCIQGVSSFISPIISVFLKNPKEKSLKRIFIASNFIFTLGCGIISMGQLHMSLWLIGIFLVSFANNIIYISFMTILQIKIEKKISRKSFLT